MRAATNRIVVRETPAVVSRRAFLIAGASVAAPWGALQGFAAGISPLGAQSYSFREFGLEDAIAKLKELGLSHMEFCSRHFPANPKDPDLVRVKDTISRAGIAVPCYGVVPFTADAKTNREYFDFARALGIGILTADPTPDSFDNLELLCRKFGVKIAIHNRRPRARYNKVEDTLGAVKGRDPSIGACVDTGHVIHSGEKPHEVIRALGPRVVSLHLKDRVFGGEERIVGEGDMDLVAVAKALKEIRFDGPIMLEYEVNPANPVPDMKQGLSAWRAAVRMA